MPKIWIECFLVWKSRTNQTDICYGCNSASRTHINPIKFYLEFLCSYWIHAIKRQQQERKEKKTKGKWAINFENVPRNVSLGDINFNPPCVGMPVRSFSFFVCSLPCSYFSLHTTKKSRRRHNNITLEIYVCSVSEREYQQEINDQKVFEKVKISSPLHRVAYCDVPQAPKSHQSSHRQSLNAQ